MDQADIHAMCNAKNALENYPEKDRNPVYKSIISMINAYLDTYCKHRVIVHISDDDSREYTMSPSYCEKCQKTFS